MASENEYLILHPENAGFYRLVMFLVTGVSLIDLNIVDTNRTIEGPISFSNRWLIVWVLLFMRMASSLSGPWRTIVRGMEYVFNFVFLNRGILGLSWNNLTVSTVTPEPKDAIYRSMMSFVSGGGSLDNKTAANFKYLPLNDLEKDGELAIAIAIRASNLAYENELRIKDTVNNKWEMSFVKYFSCWNKFIKANATHAFVFCDRPENAQWIILAFRGTSELVDWRVNLDFSHINTKVMGMVHSGFMKALGLQDEKNFANGFPSDYKGDKPLAYYTITETIQELMNKHIQAKILITGHSLGGALAILYSSLLATHKPEVLDKVEGVMTFGQPRVGDSVFCDFMKTSLGGRYKRMVYRFDVVPRVPLEITLGIHYKHFGDCIDYYSWFIGKRVDEMQDANYFDMSFRLQLYWGAIQDFFRAIWMGIWWVEWEGWVAIMSRFFGILYPGIAFHNTRNYINAARLATVT